MVVSSSGLMDELKALRRGRGVQAPGIDRLVGPALREACGIGDLDGAEVVREKIGTWVSGLVHAFPEDLRLAVTTPLALNADAQHAFLAHRVQWLADLTRRDSRTIRRRVDDGLTRLVEAASRPVPPRPEVSRDGWRVERVQVLLRLDGPVPLCTERWTVVAERDGVDRIPWPVRSELAGEHDVRVASGALLTGTDWSPMKRREFSLRFPRPLVAGESHEFSLEIRIPRIHPVRPLHIFRAPRHCSEIDLVVRFDVDRLPCSVGRVGSEFDGDDSGPVTVNPVGEVEMSFRNALPDRDCGIRWAPDTRSHLERRTG